MAPTAVRLDGTVDLTALALLGVVTGVLAWRAAARERRDYARFKRLRSTVARQKVYRRWVVEAFLSLGGLAAATILGGWASIEPLRRAAQGWPPIAASRDLLAEPYGPAVGIGVAVVVVGFLVLPVLLLRGTAVDEAPAVGDIRALLPRTRGELPYGAALSVNAGVVEELLFRLGLPALVFAVSGEAVVAFVAATLLFGLLHAYQGPTGVLASTVVGAIFVYLYLVTGSILVPIALHALFDLRSMVLIPLVLGTAAKR